MYSGTLPFSKKALGLRDAGGGGLRFRVEGLGVEGLRV